MHVLPILGWKYCPRLLVSNKNSFAQKFLYIKAFEEIADFWNHATTPNTVEISFYMWHVIFCLVLKSFCGLLYILNTVGSPAIHPELLGREAQCYQVQQSCNPAILSILDIAHVYVSPQILDVVVLLLGQGDVLYQGHAVDVEEDAHQWKLNYPPGWQHNPAQG